MVHRGELTASPDHLSQALALDSLQQDRELMRRGFASVGVGPHIHTAWTLWLLGYPNQARQRIHEALARAQALAQPLSVAYALNGAAILYGSGHEWRLAQEHAEALVALATEQSLGILAMGIVHQGTAMAAQGQIEAGLGQTVQGLAAYQASGAEAGRPTQLGYLAEIYGRAGQLEAGTALLAEAFTLVEHTADRHFEAKLYRIKGELLLMRTAPEPQEAERYFQQALVVARQQRAKAWELRTAIRLSRLWQRQGKREAALQLLKDVYGWFTEGFDTADLQR